MSAPEFTILAPVVRPPDLLRFAVASVQAQVERDFELFIVCDGAPEETIAAARAFAAEDPRIRAFVFPKGERHGEAHRHVALQEAQGAYVCQIGDDDLWLPNHLTEMRELLREVEFGALMHLIVTPEGDILTAAGDLGVEDLRQAMRDSAVNMFGPTVTGYRLETYRRLPVGWSPAPEGLWTDLHMWRKFLALPDLKVATRQAVTAISFAATLRKGRSIARRAEEIAGYATRIRTPQGRDALRQAAMKRVVDHLWRSRADEVELRERLARTEATLAGLIARLS